MSDPVQQSSLPRYLQKCPNGHYDGGTPCRLCLPCKRPTSGGRCGTCETCTPHRKPNCTYCYDGASSPNNDGSCPVCGGAGYAY